MGAGHDGLGMLLLVLIRRLLLLLLLVLVGDGLADRRAIDWG